MYDLTQESQPIKLERLFELSLDLLCVIDFEGTIQAVNPAVTRILGYSQEGLTGRPVLDLLHPEDRQELEAKVDQLVRGKEVTSFESRFRHRDGSWRWLLWNAMPCPEERVVYAACSDITERKERSEQRYRRMFETSTDGMVLLNAENGVIGSVNPCFLKMSGYRAEDLIGKPLPQADAFEAGELGKNILSGLQSGPTFRCESALRQKNGGLLAVEVLCNRYGEDHHETIQCNVRDISERKRSEAALRESEERFRILVEGVRDYAIFMMDAAGRVVSWNLGAERILGYSEHEILGMEAKITFTPEDINAGEADRELALAVADGRSEDERWHVRKNGTRFFASGVLTALWDDEGRLRGFAKIMRDITERKQHEEELLQAQKLESVGLLAGGIAHDFNNLLTGMMGNTSMALDELPKSHRLRPMLENVLFATRRAADLTRQLLAYAGKGRFVLERIRLSDMVPEMLQLVRTSIPSTAELKLDLAGDLPAIEADPSQLQQIVMNLVINAGEAIPAHGEIQIRTGRRHMEAEDLAEHREFAELKPGDYVFLEVADTGAGMNEDTKSKIFDPFFTTKFTGRGLGLAAVAGIVRSHHGAIQVTTAPGRGSRFCVYFPAVDEPAVHNRNVSQQVSRGSGLILIADDEPLVQKTATMALERHGYKVLIAGDGKQAIEAVRARGDEIALILLDIAMPVMSGEEAFSELKRIQPKVPIVICSGYSEQIARERIGVSEVETFIQKPYTGTELVQKVQSILAANSARKPGVN